ncbi:hypothetical protein HPB50_007103 [Hyalomma asiaticum]|uniref:Uncharacterized protein n=1 Tax=Hyalomma asiaticum TaxID=266040 RepID=A0ACB7RV53_HYAAI|nr:hypothetical protein HPB50_007103 [Hyalomma asiaticum]
MPGVRADHGLRIARADVDGGATHLEFPLGVRRHGYAFHQASEKTRHDAWTIALFLGPLLPFLGLPGLHAKIKRCLACGDAAVSLLSRITEQLRLFLNIRRHRPGACSIEPASVTRFVAVICSTGLQLPHCCPVGDESQRDVAGNIPLTEESSSSLAAPLQLPYDSLVSVQGQLHSCRQYTYATMRISCMRRHLLTHTGERPFRCHLCPSAFRQHGTLRDHMRTHTGERPFSCEHCSASFKQQSSLNKHNNEEKGRGSRGYHRLLEEPVASTETRPKGPRWEDCVSPEAVYYCWLQRQSPTTPVFVCSGHDSSAVARRRLHLENCHHALSHLRRQLTRPGSRVIYYR